MVDFTKNKSWAATQTIEDDADVGNIGKSTVPAVTDANSFVVNGFSNVSTPFANTPLTTATALFQSIINTNDKMQIGSPAGLNTTGLFFRKFSASWDNWAEFISTDNIGIAKFDKTLPAPGTEYLTLGRSPNVPVIDIGVLTTDPNSVMSFANPNGIIGGISLSGTTTSFNVSSDSRLKDFITTSDPRIMEEYGKDFDGAIDEKFNTLFDCFRVFNWRNDPTGHLVWGFDAHACIDAGLEMGTEGEGGRDLALGDVYSVIPAVIEPQERQVAYKTGDKKGELRFNPDGSPMMETVDVVVTPEIEEKVSPAGVDQAKAVPILLAKLEQLERRLVAAGL